MYQWYSDQGGYENARLCANAASVLAVQVEEEFRKCGVVALDPETQQPRVKLYRDQHVSVLRIRKIVRNPAEGCITPLTVVDPGPSLPSWQSAMVYPYRATAKATRPYATSRLSPCSLL